MNTAVMEPTTGYEISITRTFDAPRELVWKAWTDPEMAKEWMGPRGFTTTEFTTSDQPGGHWHLTMVGHRPGLDSLVTLGQGGTILEIEPPELLKYTFGWDSRASVGLGDGPKENVITIRFEDRGERTVMHFHQGPFATEGERDGHNGGWNSAFDCFAEFVLRVQPERKSAADDVPSELHLRRFFAAPRQLVFDAWTKPEMVEQWWGPHGFTTKVEELDARSGGGIRFLMKGHGMEHTMTGRFVEFYPPYRFHFTAAVPGPNGDILFENWNSVFFEQVEGGTEVVLDVHVIKSTDDAAVYLKGMREGWSQTLDRLLDFVLGEQERKPALDEVPNELLLRRFFAAPRQLVFDAWTKPEMVKEWWGPNGFTIPKCEIDARPGGEFLIQMKAPDGTVGALKGRYVEFYPPYRFHYIGTPLDKDGNAMCETWTSVHFEEKNEGTEVVVNRRFTKRPADPARFIEGASKGWSQMFVKLDEFVKARQYSGRQ